jgi:subtilisin family serine protease
MVNKMAESSLGAIFGALTKGLGAPARRVNVDERPAAPDNTASNVPFSYSYGWRQADFSIPFQSSPAVAVPATDTHSSGVFSIEGAQAISRPLDPNLFAQMTTLGGPDDDHGSRSPGAPKFLPTTTEILVQFSKDSSLEQRQAAIAAVGGVIRDVVRGADAENGDLVLISLPTTNGEAALNALSASPGVRFAEPNWSVGAQLVSNDANYINGNLWGMYGDKTSPVNAFGSQSGEAWAAGFVGKSTVVVGDIDTGIDYTHPDLFLNVWLNQGELPQGMKLQDVDADGLITFRDLNSSSNASFVTDINKNGRIDAGDLLNDVRWENGSDGDANGYVDDLIGWDFVNNDNDPYDDNGHGTHTAGTIGAIGGNQLGVAGVNWNVQIVGLKFLSASGSGSTAGAIRALDYYTAAAALDQTRGWRSEFVATNNSWGGGGFSQSMLDSIVRSGRQDLLFVAAAGNGGTDGIGDNNDVTANFPSNYSTLNTLGYEAVIAVAALTSTGALATYSNYGGATVDLGAPGSGIWSTTPGGGYASYSGTSMATPHVTGAIALSASKDPNASASQLRSSLFLTVAPTSSLSNKTVTGGRLDVGRLINSSPGAPPPPTVPAGVTIYGSVKNDNLTGTAYADLLSGIPVSGTNLGKGTIDTLSGLQGNDLFILGDARGRFYDDGLSSRAGTSDYALITDFSPGADKIQLKGGSYFIAMTTISGVNGTGIFFDSDGNRSLGNRDEFIGLLKGVAVSSVSSSDFSWA